MGIYLFQHPETSEVKEIFQKMNDKHEFIDENNTPWLRLYTVPQSSVDTKLDPFDIKKATEKSGRMKGNLGNLFDESASLSEKRSQIMGKDPLREKALKDYAAKRNGKQYFDPKNEDKTFVIE